MQTMEQAPDSSPKPPKKKEGSQTPEDIREITARTKTVSVTPEQAEAEWQAWQAMNRKIAEAPTLPPTMGSETISPEDIRYAFGWPEDQKKLMREVGTKGAMVLKPDNRDDFRALLNSLHDEGTFLADDARRLAPFFDPELPLEIPEEELGALHRILDAIGNA